MAARFEDAVEHAAQEAKRAAEGGKDKPAEAQPGANQPADHRQPDNSKKRGRANDRVLLPPLFGRKDIQ